MQNLVLIIALPSKSRVARTITAARIVRELAYSIALLHDEPLVLVTPREWSRLTRVPGVSALNRIVDAMLVGVIIDGAPPRENRRWSLLYYVDTKRKAVLLVEGARPAQNYRRAS